jgi:hypothetical protein
MVYLCTFEALPGRSARTTRRAHAEGVPVLSPICYVNRQTFAVYLPTILAPSGKGLVVQSYSYEGMKVLVQFLNRVPCQCAFKSVQRLHVSRFYTYVYPKWDTLAAFQGFRILHLQPYVRNCIDKHEVSPPARVNKWRRFTYTLSSIETVASRSQLPKILEPPVLQSLHLECLYGALWADDVGCSGKGIFAALKSVAFDAASKKPPSFELHFDFDDPHITCEIQGDCRWAQWWMSIRW